MSKYIDAEKLKVEVERRKGELMYGSCSALIQVETNCKNEAYNEILSFITSLQQEQPQVADASKMEQEVDLEKEIDKGIVDYSFTKTIDSGGFKTTVIDYAKIARHFYELGLRARKEE